jgi:phosphatidate cytidylyltransferase
MSGEGEAVKRVRQMTGEDGKDKESDAKSSDRLPLLGALDQRWRNWWIRGILSIVMISLFAVVIYLGPIALSLLVVGLLLKCFQEIIAIGYSKYREHNLPLYRVLNWYIAIVASMFIYCDNFFYYYPELKGTTGLFSFFGQYHRIICLSLYVAGFVLFVLTLQKDLYNTQFSMFTWTHITLFLFGFPAYLSIQNTFESIFWLIVPVSLVVCNDIMAYLFGFFLGRTPLIKLSPKKTWEGFIGAVFATMLFGLILSHMLAKYDYFVCFKGGTDCERPAIFVLQEYNVGTFFFYLYPAVLHSLALSVFASLLAPFGGFFASGFKRAFKVKDFADVIPGHGGIVDRFDCQLLMAVFANVYYFTFCRSPDPDKLVAILLSLPLDQQREIFTHLQQALANTS